MHAYGHAHVWTRVLCTRMWMYVSNKCCLQPGVPGLPSAGTLRPHQGTIVTHMPHWQALPMGSPVSLRPRLLSGQWQEGTGSPGFFLSCHKLRCSISSLQVHDHGLCGLQAGTLSCILTGSPLQVWLSPGCPELAGWTAQSSWEPLMLRWFV